MKTVFTNNELPHVFAAQSQREGRNAGNSLFFIDQTLFSYRHSVPIAHLHEGRALLNAQSYSVTTSRHQSGARRALSHMNPVELPELRNVIDILTHKSERKALEYVESRIKTIDVISDKKSRMRSDWKKQGADSEIAAQEYAADFVWQAIGKRSDWRKAVAPKLAKMKKAESVARFEKAMDNLKYWIVDGFKIEMERFRQLSPSHATRSDYIRFENLVATHNRADILGAARGDGFGATATWTHARKIMPKKWVVEYKALVAELERMAEPMRVELEQLRVERDRLEREKNAERIEQWLNGENINLPRIAQVYCRVIGGDTVQTSHGARVPLADALRVVKLAQQCRESAKPFRKDSFATGIHKGIVIDEKGNVTIGCHRIAFESISDAFNRFNNGESK